MTLRNQLRQFQLWTQPYAAAGVELPASRRRELTAELADLLWQFAITTADTNREQGGDAGHDEHE